MLMFRVARTLVFVSLIALFAGCRNRPATLNAWQGRVQSYVVERGNGDLNSLRQPQVAPGQPGFRIFSSDNLEDSTDFAGVLVGVHQSPTRMWYVYVLGEVSMEQLKATRLAALSASEGQFTWRMGEDDKAATATYRQHHAKAGPHQDTPDSTRRTMMVSFPNSGDQFDLQGSGDTITVREGASGAQWTLDLAMSAQK